MHSDYIMILESTCLGAPWFSKNYISIFKFCSDLFSLYFAMHFFTLTASLSFWLKQIKINWKTTVLVLYVFDNFNVILFIKLILPIIMIKKKLIMRS